MRAGRGYPLNRRKNKKGGFKGKTEAARRITAKKNKKNKKENFTKPP